MKWFTKLIVFVALLVVSCSPVQSRVTSDISVLSPTGHDAAPRCPHDTTDNSTSVLLLLHGKQSSCINLNWTFNKFMYITVLFSNIDLSYKCAQLPNVSACMDEVGIEAAACLKNMEARVLQLSRENAEIIMSFICVDSNDTKYREFVEQSHELENLDTNTRFQVLDCFTSSKRSRSADIPANIMKKYRDTKEARQCIMNVAQEHQLKTSGIEKYYDMYLRSMKCISPVTKEIVLCSSLE